MSALDYALRHIKRALDDCPDDETRAEVRRGIIASLEYDAAEDAIARISKRIRAAFPTAVTLRAEGEWNEDSLLRLYPRELVDAEGASLGSSDEPSTEWANVFDDDDLYDDLVELAESDDNYEGEAEITLT